MENAAAGQILEGVKAVSSPDWGRGNKRGYSICQLPASKELYPALPHVKMAETDWAQSLQWSRGLCFPRAISQRLDVTVINDSV